MGGRQWPFLINPKTSTYYGGVFDDCVVEGQSPMTKWSELQDMLAKLMENLNVRQYNQEDFAFLNAVLSQEQEPAGQGGRNAADYVELARDVGGPFGAGAKIILDNRGAYMPRGQIYKMNKEITVRTPIGGINTTSKALNYVRVGGKVVVIAGVLATGYQVGHDLLCSCWNRSC